MAQKLTLNATKRENSGTGFANRLRRQGIVPGVIYGANQDNYSIQVDSREFSDLLHHSASESMLVTLKIEGAKEAEKLALVQAVQHHPLTGAIVHVDFQAVREDQDIHANVPIELIGEPEGVRNGGMLDHQVHMIEVRCKPSTLPEKIELSVGDLQIGQARHVSDIVFPEGVYTAMEPDVVIAMVQEIKVPEAAEEVAGVVDVAEGGEKKEEAGK